MLPSLTHHQRRMRLLLLQAEPDLRLCVPCDQPWGQPPAWKGGTWESQTPCQHWLEWMLWVSAHSMWASPSMQTNTVRLCPFLASPQSGRGGGLGVTDPLPALVEIDCVGISTCIVGFSYYTGKQCQVSVNVRLVLRPDLLGLFLCFGRGGSGREEGVREAGEAHNLAHNSECRQGA